MLKFFILSALAVLGIAVGANIVFKVPEQKHPGRPLSTVPYKGTAQKHRKFRPIVRARFETNIPRPNFGSKSDGCNRISPFGGDCDALQYYNSDWSDYANGIVHRGI